MIAKAGQSNPEGRPMRLKFFRIRGLGGTIIDADEILMAEERKNKSKDNVYVVAYMRNGESFFLKTSMADFIEDIKKEGITES
jgi:hypothetical protein